MAVELVGRAVLCRRWINGDRRARSGAPYLRSAEADVRNLLSYFFTSSGTVAFARLVNAATAVFAAEAPSRHRPISNPRFLPRRRMALSFRFSRPRNAIFGIKAPACEGPSERSRVSIALISAIIWGRT